MDNKTVEKATPQPTDDSSKSDLTLPVVSHQSVPLRRTIQLAYWAVVLACVPVWWYMTSIERLSLPESRILAQQKAIEDITAHVNIIIHSNERTDTSSLSQKVGALLDDYQASDPDSWRGTRVTVVPDKPRGIAHEADEYHVYLHATHSDRSHEVQGRNLNFFSTNENNDAIADELAALLQELVNPTATLGPDNRVIQYSPNLRLAFSLLNEDIHTSGQRGWAAETNINNVIKSTLDLLSPLHNFTIETQVQYYAPLAFEPPKKDRGFGSYYALGKDELKIFVNSAEWSLSSEINNDPVLHFLLFVPADHHRPLFIYDESTNAPLKSPAFIIPQWGGVVLFNPSFIQSPRNAAEIFSLFRTQLLTLLGVSQLPSNVVIAPGPDGSKEPLSPWQIDALLRQRIRENTEGSIQALTSIIKLVNQLKNMPVGTDVKGEILQAIEQLEMMNTPETSPRSALELFTRSRHALAYSSKAFFNPGMVGQLYFPAEHKYAIYMLFAPASMGLIISFVREVKPFIKRRRDQKKVE
ncbi:GPI transamidase component [Serendipita sp. 399]|nr:GPI transamidase component [Serendipita sp. 399]